MGFSNHHALRYSFTSILVAQGKTWDQIAAFVDHLDQRATRRYVHFKKDKRATVESIPFEFWRRNHGHMHRLTQLS